MGFSMQNTRLNLGLVGAEEGFDACPIGYRPVKKMCIFGFVKDSWGKRQVLSSG
jgi:hypothetical protein